MKTIRDLVQQETTSLRRESPQESQEVRLIKDTEKNEISIFKGEPASPQQIGVSIKKLQVCFPAMEKDFFSVLAEYIVKDNMASDRLSFAIDNVIRNFKYKQISVADIVGVDKRIKLYTYHELVEMVTAGKARFEDFPIIEVKGKKFRISLEDKIKYNL